MKPQETVCYTIKTAWHAIYRMYNTEAVKHNITTSIGFVLLNIDVKEGTPATKIGPLIGLETRSLTRMLKTLEQDGLIERRSDSRDKRLVRIYLTPLGLERREAARKTVKAFNLLVKDRISEDKLNIFFEVMNEILSTSEHGKQELI